MEEKEQKSGRMEEGDFLRIEERKETEVS